MPYRVPGPDEFIGNDFGLLAEDEYRVRIASYEMKSGAIVTNQYNPDGSLRIWFTLEPLAIEGDDDAVLVDPDGKEVSEDKTLIFFFDPSRLGLKPVVSKNRKFFAAAMGIPVEQPVSFDSEEDMARTLVGKELVASVIIKNGKNNISDTRPIRTRVRKSRAPLVEEAAAVFAEPLPVNAGEDEGEGY